MLRLRRDILLAYFHVREARNLLFGVISVRFALVPCLSELVYYCGCMCWLDLLFGYENIDVAGWTVGETYYSCPSDPISPRRDL